MKKNYVIIALLSCIICTLIGCNKDTSTTTKLLGKWKAVSLTYKDNEGLSKKPSCSGTATFDKSNSTYSINLNYPLPYFAEGLNNHKGTFQVIDKGSKLILTDSLSSQASQITTQIDFITSTDLVLRYYDKSYRLYEYVFKKN